MSYFHLLFALILSQFRTSLSNLAASPVRRLRRSSGSDRMDERASREKYATIWRMLADGLVARPLREVRALPTLLISRREQFCNKVCWKINPDFSFRFSAWRNLLSRILKSLIESLIELSMLARKMSDLLIIFFDLSTSWLTETFRQFSFAAIMALIGRCSLSARDRGGDG